VFLSALVIWPFSLLTGSKESIPTANVAHWLSVTVSLFSLVGLMGALYALFIKRIAGFPAIAAGVSPLATLMLGILLVGVILGFALPIFTILAWKDGYWPIWGRIHYTFLTISTLAFEWWLNYWNLLGFRF
jgi:hypothetical protein